jgi:hypothetical protein
VDLTGDRGRTRAVALGELRVASALLLAGAVVQPFLPGPGGLPCPLREITSVPCPLCGMTTSVVASVHGRFGDALAANPAGLLAVAFAIVLLLWRRPKVVLIPSWVPLVALAAMWLFELHRFSVI